jgi:hypothetical protein
MQQTSRRNRFYLIRLLRKRKKRFAFFCLIVLARDGAQPHASSIRSGGHLTESPATPSRVATSSLTFIAHPNSPNLAVNGKGSQVRKSPKYGVREFLYCHGQAGTVKKFTGVSVYMCSQGQDDEERHSAFALG